MPVTALISFVAAAFEKKMKNNFPPLPPIMVSRYKRYITYGIRAKVKTLGPDGLIDIQVCCELCDLTM